MAAAKDVPRAMLCRSTAQVVETASAAGLDSCTTKGREVAFLAEYIDDIYAIAYEDAIEALKKESCCGLPRLPAVNKAKAVQGAAVEPVHCYSAVGKKPIGVQLVLSRLLPCSQVA